MDYIKESIRQDDYIYISASGSEEKLKNDIEMVATGLHRAMTQRNIDTLVGYNALISLLGTYSARMTNGDPVAIDEICDASAELVKDFAVRAHKAIYTFKPDD